MICVMQSDVCNGAHHYKCMMPYINFTLLIDKIYNVYIQTYKEVWTVMHEQYLSISACMTTAADQLML